MACEAFSVTEARKLSNRYRGASENTTRKLCTMAFNKVRYFATMGRDHMVWQVPVLIPDAPLYDRQEACDRVVTILRQAGYSVVPMTDFMLFVTWAH
jgi:hypothetical protein